MKTRTKGLTGNTVGRHNLPGFGHAFAFRLCEAQHQSLRRYRNVLLAFVCGLVLAGCAMPESTTQPQDDQNAKVEAIQTRVAETRAEKAAAKEEAMAAETDASDGTDEQTTAADDSDSALVVGPTAQQLEILAKLRPQGEAPELFNEVWLNAEPMKLADLRGKVVLVEFWTYG